ncbi:LruC domain-containing protein [Vibrio sp. 10N.222.54.F6]|uniref:LruC domain-containing protein n=1 Tax=unclassified Vibrio TaxID=2614977 RepID=UPI000C86033A|nr:LruC domain-containing protein [Vibrio sp. 10N.261.51.A7]PML69269.1 LruC domain-containing protein [Vibrio sp. 10N.261.51.A7]
MKNIKKSLMVMGSVAMCSFSQQTFAAATENTTTTNGDGSITVTQKIDASSTSPHYIAPSGYGFDIYSRANEDYSWQHNLTVPDGAQITAATLTIYAYDVDSEAHHGENGEYDSIAVDGSLLTPGFLQGTNNNWSTTVFDLPIASLDDSLVNVDLDIDVNNDGWLTTLDYSLISVTYVTIANTPPSTPTLSRSTGLGDNDDLVVTVTGPTPEDPDGDSVTYSYRWFVDVGQGFYVDDEFVGKNDNSNATLPASETEVGELWKVQVIAIDQNGLISEIAEIAWPSIGDSDGDGVSDANDYAPNDPTIAFYSRTPTSGWYTLAYEDLWPNEGDYDLNDFVSHYALGVYTNANNQITRFDYYGQAIARGAAEDNGFAISLAGLEDTDVTSLTKTYNGSTAALTPEAGHSGELVFVVIDSVAAMLPSTSTYSFYNTESGDARSLIDYSVSLVIDGSIPALSNTDFNPFIYKGNARGREIHLMNYPNTDVADTAIFGAGDDDTVTSEGEYYQNTTGHPWALDIPGQWSHPYERIDTCEAYEHLTTWAESGGTLQTDWFTSPTGSKVW